MNPSSSMSLQHPARSRAQWRSLFFEEVDRLADLLEEEWPAGDALRHLPDGIVQALRSSDLRLLKYPLELGGAEADNGLQFEVFERLAYHNAAAAWCMFIYADLIGVAAAHLSDEGFARVFANGIPLIVGGGGGRFGDLSPALGGYRVTGRWSYGSGYSGAEWVNVFGTLTSDAGPPEIIRLFIPIGDLTPLDDWHVLGLRGSGSYDFLAEDVFVPIELTSKVTDRHSRGGALYQLGLIPYVCHTVPAVALGIARRALDEVTALGRGKLRRALDNDATMMQSPAFQTFLAEADIKLRAVRALMMENGIRLVDEIASTSQHNPRTEAEARAAACYTTRVSVEVTSGAVRFAGSDGIWQGKRLEQAIRDVNVAASHVLVTDAAIDLHGALLLGSTT